ncbi:MAG: hypothetical protein WDM96_18330 [Lacunisphaera sp.]
MNARPDFLILMYPVITMADPAAHAARAKRCSARTRRPSCSNSPRWKSR